MSQNHSSGNNYYTNISSNKCIVSKFGGTSVATVKDISQCAKILLLHKEIKIVVVSAQAGVTNILTIISNIIVIKSAELLFEQLKNIIYPIVYYINSESIANCVDNYILDLFLLAQMCCRLYTKKLVDEILSFGEKISALLVVGVFNKLGIVASYFNAKTIIKTNSNFGEAKVDIDLIKRQVEGKLLPNLEKTIFVIEGFIGSDLENSTTTLGRGGSDYSAALIAQAVGARFLQIWTDVKGIYQVNPSIIPVAKVIDYLSFDEAAELATFGAKVLHPATLFPAISKNIPIFVGSTFFYNFGGTWIDNFFSKKFNIRAIAERKNQILIVIKSFNMFNSKGFLAAVFSVLAKLHISVDLVNTSEINIALTIDYTENKKINKNFFAEKLLSELESMGNIEVFIEENLSLISIVGNNLHHQKGVSGKLFSSLKKYNIRLFNHGASGHNICMLVHQHDSFNVIKQIYNTFF